MALIIPAATSTYGDSSSTGGGKLRQYVLAQYRLDADLSWVRLVRSSIVRDELKYADFHSNKSKLRSNAPLWGKIEAGIGQASIIVIDPGHYSAGVEQRIRADKLSIGRDISQREVLGQCAVAIIKDTPVAFLPDELMKAVPWRRYTQMATLRDFTPSGILHRIGNDLNAAVIFAARAHATFDLPSTRALITSTNDTFRSPVAELALAELLNTTRFFDNENPHTASVLNEAAEAISEHMGQIFDPGDYLPKTPLVSEMDSHEMDHLQASDVAAGWARDLIELGDLRSLGRRFESVWVNGRKMT